MRTFDPWKLLPLAAQIWWLGMQVEHQRNRLHHAVEHGMAMSDPALMQMAEPFHRLCVRYCLLEREYLLLRGYAPLHSRWAA